MSVIGLMRSFTSRLTVASVCQTSEVSARIAGSALSILHSAGIRRQKAFQAEVGLALPLPTKCGLDGGRAVSVCAGATLVQASAARLAAIIVKMRILTRRAPIRRARDLARSTRAWRMAPTPCLSFVNNAPESVKPWLKRLNA